MEIWNVKIHVRVCLLGFRYGTIFRLWDILGDPGAVSRAGGKGATKVFKHRRKSPCVPTLTGPFPNGQANAGSWLATKNALYYCAQSANSISWVLFGEFVHDGYWLDYGLSGSYTKEMHAAVRKLSVWYKLSGIIKILSTRRLKTLFQKYKPALTTGIHAFIYHASVNIRKFKMPRQLTATKTSDEKWIHIFFSLYRDYSN